MTTTIYSLVNAGLYFNFDGTGILVDGIHEGQKKGFSPMPPQLDRDLKHHAGIFSDLRGAVFTHLHADHFDQRRLDYLMQFSSHLSVYGPKLSCSNVCISSPADGPTAFPIDAVQCLAVSTIHDGDCYRREPHRSLFLQSDAESFFIAGDALLRPQELLPLEAQLPLPVTAAFINMFHASSADGLAYLRRLRPGRIFLYHLPFREDDDANYWRWARQLVRRWPEDLPPLEIPEPMHWIDNSSVMQSMQQII